jgi:hypothetical protein
VASRFVYSRGDPLRSPWPLYTGLAIRFAYSRGIPLRVLWPIQPRFWVHPLAVALASRPSPILTLLSIP